METLDSICAWLESKPRDLKREEENIAYMLASQAREMAPSRVGTDAECFDEEDEEEEG